MAHNFKGGDEVIATEQIISKSRHVEEKDWVLAQKGDKLVVRSSSPLEVSNRKNLLLSFDVQPHQIELVKGEEK